MDRIAPRLPLKTATDLDRLRMSQTLQVLSWLPVEKVSPSGCHADAKEKSKCPTSVPSVCRKKSKSVKRKKLFYSEDLSIEIVSLHLSRVGVYEKALWVVSHNRQ